MKAELGDRSNVQIVYADLTSHSSLKQAAADTAAIVGDRGVDYLIANAAYMSHFDGFDPIGALSVYLYHVCWTVLARLLLTLCIKQGQQPR